MSWLSRLLTPGSSLHHRASKSQLRREKNYRRKLTMDCLEDRPLMANITAVYTPGPANSLVITADIFHNAFQITENAPTAAINPGGVTIHPITAATAINTLVSFDYVSPGPVTQLSIVLPGSPLSGNVDKIVILGQGKATPTSVVNTTITATSPMTTIGLAVGTTAANGVNNAGSFTLNTAGPLAGPGTALQLPMPTITSGAATIQNSTFKTNLTVNQTGTSLLSNAALTLNNDAVGGTATVSEGAGTGDAITVGGGSSFGATTLSQGNGVGDTVSVVGTVAAPNTVKSLVVNQGTGNSDAITVTNLVLSSIIGVGGVGLKTTQGAGNSDNTTITGVSVTGFLGGPITNVPPPGFVLAGINVTQGAGNSDIARVSSVVVPGDVVINQGAGNTDEATIDTGTTVSTIHGSISITQGVGNNDTATVRGATVGSNVTILQGLGNSDIVNVFGTIAGSVVFNGVFNVDTDGNLSVTQGNGYNDIVNIDSNPPSPTTGAKVLSKFNNITVVQGNSTPGGPLVPAGYVGPYLGDVINLNDTNVTSDITLTQGTSAAFGNYAIGIGTTSAVTALGVTTINQHGGFNVIQLGGAFGGGFDFSTVWLDITMSFAGDAITGGSFILAVNTQVWIGSFVGNPWVIDGAGIDNVFFDFGANSGVNASSNFFF